MENKAVVSPKRSAFRRTHSFENARRFFLRGCLPGLAPAGEVLSFASPKESTQRKGDPTKRPAGWSREFGSHAIRLRNGLRLQAQTPSPASPGAAAGSETNSLPLQGAYPLASGYRSAGAGHVPRTPCFTSDMFRFFFRINSRSCGALPRVERQHQRPHQFSGPHKLSHWIALKTPGLFLTCPHLRRCRESDASSG